MLVPSLALALALSAEPHPLASEAAKVPHLQLNFSGGGANQSSAGAGTGFSAGIRGFGDIQPVLQWYWGAELWGVRAGSSVLSLINATGGLRYTPFPEWPARPYVRGDAGLGLLIILPVPTASLALGVTLPVFNAFFLDLSVGYRRAFSIYGGVGSVDLAAVEFGLAF